MHNSSGRDKTRQSLLGCCRGASGVTNCQARLTIGGGSAGKIKVPSSVTPARRARALPPTAVHARLDRVELPSARSLSCTEIASVIRHASIEVFYLIVPLPGEMSLWLTTSYSFNQAAGERTASPKSLANSSATCARKSLNTGAERGIVLSWNRCRPQPTAFVPNTAPTA